MAKNALSLIFTCYDDLMLLNDLDRRGRVPGAFACEIDEALQFLRELAAEV
jgi:hypothetical protein